jgi:hypothetical protein
MMKKTFIKIIIIFSLVFLFVTCNDPIFFIVSEEIPILKPLINGSPTNFVEYSSKLYVASGKEIFSYSSNKWSKWKEINDRVVSLASTGTALYALYLNNDDGDEGKIKNLNGNDLSLSNVQSIYASDDVLFACTRNSSNVYKIYFRKEGTSGFTEISVEQSSILKGAASDTNNFYLCTNNGILYVDKTLADTSSNVLETVKDIDFTGIIKLGTNYVAAISNDGKLYEITNATIRKPTEFSDDRSSTGALAIWYSNNTATEPSLLLVGRNEKTYTTTTGYSNGYVEITLDATTGAISGSGFNEPGKSSPSSIDNNDRYVSSLGKKPVNHIIQAPATIDSNMTLFASTQQNGVWSYKDRGDGLGMQWNAEN